jgi:hypothetical protein
VNEKTRTDFGTWILMAALTVVSLAALWAVVNLIYALR